MITINQEQLGQVEYLIHQSIQGYHVLFNTHTLREIFQRPDGDALNSPENLFLMEKHLEKLLERQSLEMKRAYLEALDTQTYEQVVRAYFNIVENNLFENPESRH